MNLPNIPTDNIFKFFFITALLIMIIGFLYPKYKLYEIEEQRILINKSIAILEAERKVISRDLKDFEKYVKRNSSIIEFSIGDSMIHFSAPIMKSSYSYFDRQLLDEIQSKVSSYHKYNDESDLKIIEINNQKELLNNETEKWHLYLTLGTFAILISGFFLLIGFKGWFQEEVLKLEILKYKHRQITKHKGYCQSCGMDINSDPKVSDIFANYCSFCCDDDNFNHTMNFEEFCELVKNRLSELKWNKRNIDKHIRDMKKLNRWNNKFIW